MRTRGIGICIVALALLAAAPAQGAFPGRPGPIAYSKTTNGEEVGELHGGLLAHPPRLRQPATTLTEEPYDSYPSYSADGRLVVFASKRRTAAESRGIHIFVMRNDGSGVRQLTTGDFYDSNPAFSPDGNAVVFDRRPTGGGYTHIFEIGVDGGDLRQLTAGNSTDTDPTYAPNGRWIAFVSNRRRLGSRDQSNIFSMRPNGGRVQLLVSGPRNEFDPDVSPNGRWIAFASNRRSGPNVFVARIRGRRLRQLTHSRHSCFSGACYSNPSWAPDGKHIAYRSRGRYSSGVDVIRADGRGKSKELAGAGIEEEGYGSTVGPPSWGPQPR